MYRLRRYFAGKPDARSGAASRSACFVMVVLACAPAFASDPESVASPAGELPLRPPGLAASANYPAKARVKHGDATERPAYHSGAPMPSATGSTATMPMLHTGPYVGGPAAGAVKFKAQTLPQAPPDESVEDMQALIAATRSLAHTTRTTADSIGMTQDRLTGILSRLDRIEARVNNLAPSPGHPAPGSAHSGWR